MRKRRKHFANTIVFAAVLFTAIAPVRFATPLMAQTKAPSTAIDPKILALAKAGDTKSQLFVGYAYYAGEGTTSDLIEAAAWYRKAAENGDATAQFTVGLANIYDLFGTEDHTQADIWLRKSAGHANLIDLHEVPAILIILDNPYAQLGVLYEDGKDLPQDYSQAAFWFRRGAEQGDKGSQNLLGALYFDGKGVSQDYAQAAAWFRKAAVQGDMEAQSNIGGLYLVGRGVPQDYREAEKWLSKAADQGNATALYNLGTMYAKGQGVQQNNTGAYLCFDLAAARQTGPDQADAEKARDLAASLLTPEDLSKAQQAAEKWFAAHPARR
jgi:TPR repeat protein